jgi:hypothetical protein
VTHGADPERDDVNGLPARRMSPAVAVPRLSRVIAVADLSAVARSAKADVAQLAERVLGKDEVTGSIPVIGSRIRSLPRASGGQGSRSGRRFELRLAGQADEQGERRVRVSGNAGSFRRRA